jgi:hypothetical protein
MNFRLAHSAGKANRRCQLRIWRLLVPRENSDGVGFDRDSWPHHARIFR